MCKNLSAAVHKKEGKTRRSNGHGEEQQENWQLSFMNGKITSYFLFSVVLTCELTGNRRPIVQGTTNSR